MVVPALVSNVWVLIAVGSAFPKTRPSRRVLRTAPKERGLQKVLKDNVQLQKRCHSNLSSWLTGVPTTGSDTSDCWHLRRTSKILTVAPPTGGVAFLVSLFVITANVRAHAVHYCFGVFPAAAR